MKTKPNKKILKQYSDLYRAVEYVLTQCGTPRRTVFTQSDFATALSEFNETNKKNYSLPEIEREFEVLGDYLYTKTETSTGGFIYEIKARTESLKLIHSNISSTEDFLQAKEIIKSGRNYLGIKFLKDVAKSIRMTGLGYFMPLSIFGGNPSEVEERLGTLRDLLSSGFDIHMSLLYKYLSDGRKCVKIRLDNEGELTFFYRLIYWVGTPSDLLECLVSDEISGLGKTGSMLFSSVMKRFMSSKSHHINYLVSLILGESKPPMSEEYEISEYEDDFRITYIGPHELPEYEKARKTREGFTEVRFKSTVLDESTIQSNFGLYTEKVGEDTFEAYIPADTHESDVQFRKLLKLKFYLDLTDNSEFVLIPGKIEELLDKKLSDIVKTNF